MLSRARSQGQSLVVFLAFAAAMVGMLLVAFNSGQVTNAKMRAMNAADAAAYSGAQWQARNLNFQAYMNRAIVVNEVTIAQSVSIRSWASYVKKTVDNIETLSVFFPPVYAWVGRVSNVIDTIEGRLQDILPRAENALRWLANVEHDAQKVFDNAVIVAAPDLARRVAQANGASISAGGAGMIGDSMLEWARFTETYAPGRRNMGARDRRARLREVILKSRDGFVQERDWVLTLPLRLAELRKQGGTDLIDYDTWKGLDSLELRWEYDWIKRKWNQDLPVGWGGAQAFAPQRQNGRGTHGEINEWNHWDGRLARGISNDSSHAKRLNDRLSGYRDLSAEQMRALDPPRLPFMVEVVIGGIPTSGGAGMRAQAVTLKNERLNMDPQYAPRGASGVFATAAACIAFERPYGAERRDRLREKPSLFNTYWRASMATPSRRVRVAADLLKGLPPISAIVGGNGSCER